MSFLTPEFLLTLQTIHVPLADVPKLITEDAILESLRIISKLKDDRIAVLALNPHGGERGLMGEEEMRIIVPAMKRAKKEGINVDGPFPADSFFIDRYKNYSLILAMYHDQGLIPVKTRYPRESVNLTEGLPIVRTSVDHGVGYDIAGTATADETALLHAMKAALERVH